MADDTVPLHCRHIRRYRSVRKCLVPTSRYPALTCSRTVRAMIAENSTKKTQAQAFSYFAFAGNLGLFIGPFLGGALERPADKFPSTFGHVQFFRDYPYALPGFAAASIGLSAAVLNAMFVKEVCELPFLWSSYADQVL
jgi:MFS family permease